VAFNRRWRAIEAVEAGVERGFYAALGSANPIGTNSNRRTRGRTDRRKAQRN
jgi:hypothetical protein